MCAQLEPQEAGKDNLRILECNVSNKLKLESRQLDNVAHIENVRIPEIIKDLFVIKVRHRFAVAESFFTNGFCIAMATASAWSFATTKNFL